VGWQDFGSASGEMILGNTFDNAGRAGLEVRNGAQNVTVEHNCFSLNGSSPPTFSPCTAGPCPVIPFGGIRIQDDGASPGTSGTAIHNNNFAGNNAPHGVTDNSAASMNTDGEAENNWWGCAAGPGNTGCDSVTSNVDFTPFLTFPAAGTPCTPPSADLSVSKADSPDPVHRGQKLTYTIMVHNAGPDSAMGVTLTDTLPKATGFDSVATTQGTCTRTPKNTVQCSLGNLAKDATVTVTIVVKPTQKKPGMITNTVSVKATSPGDPNTANNSASASTMVVP
jgi:uncharacterized repeat protein (TIGR01451 family)